MNPCFLNVDLCIIFFIKTVYDKIRTIMTDKEEFLKLDNQLCFAAYSASRAIIRAYKPLLDRLGITYTQYITLMVLWEHKTVSMNKLGEYLNLDSGTLTPLLKKMEKSGLIERKRAENDERQINIAITKKGKALKEEALKIPEQMFCKLPMGVDDACELRDMLKKLYMGIKI